MKWSLTQSHKEKQGLRSLAAPPGRHVEVAITKRNRSLLPAAACATQPAPQDSRRWPRPRTEFTHELRDTERDPPGDMGRVAQGVKNL
jgi:hypothetical protein